MDDQQQTPFGQPPAGDDQHQQHEHRPRRTRRLVATVAATALVAGVGGVGVGYAAGHGFGGATRATSNGNQQTTNPGGSGGVESIPGYGWGGGNQGGTPVDPFSGGQGSSDQSTDTTKASASQLTGLVRVVSTMRYAGAKAAGTGMILTSDGEVVTNHHVVEGATSVKVKVMSTGKTYVAKVVGTDARDDVAVLQLTGASRLSTVETDTDGVSVGDPVTAVGDANGTVDYLSAASGEVMALGQSITTQSEGTATGQRLTDLIKISSDVVSGDSGGATYDSDGEVVGMTTAASSGSSDIVGYAVPISTVVRVADDIEDGVSNSQYDYTRPAFLGVGLGETGTTVQGVYDGTPAADAGIAAGDRITAIGSTQVGTSTQLTRAVASHSPGDDVSVSWTSTDGSTHTETVTLGTGAVE